MMSFVQKIRNMFLIVLYDLILFLLDWEVFILIAAYFPTYFPPFTLLQTNRDLLSQIDQWPIVIETFLVS